MSNMETTGVMGKIAACCTLLFGSLTFADLEPLMKIISFTLSCIAAIYTVRYYHFKHKSEYKTKYKRLYNKEKGL